jgi:adenylate cyclase
MPASAANRLWVRKLRLCTGLTMFTYVALHLLDHSLGNISIALMEAGLVAQKWFWQGIVGTTLLYPAMATHYALGLWAFYERRHFGWTATEIVQLVLGLSIPFLLMNHLFVTRISLAAYGTQKGYAQELYSFWVASPQLGALQVSVLIVAWIHGCIGVYHWLRLKRMFARWGPALLCIAVLLPVLALLGFFQGGRTILALANDPAWRAANLAPWQVGTPPDNRQLLLWRNRSLLAALGLLAIAAFARAVRAVRERRGSAIRVTYPDGRSVRVPIGFSVLDASRSARVPHASICGGRGRCSTCRIRIIGGAEAVPAASQGELAVLRRISAEPGVRLACQSRPVGDVSVVPLLPSNWPLAALRRREWPMPGEERFIVVLIIDMRNSTRLVETRLPFDAVFIVDRFVTAAGSAVDAHGGRVSHFLGDGLMATFGLQCGPRQACLQALSALVAISRNIAGLNRVLVAEIGEPVRFGVGVHCSTAVVGEIGHGAMRTFTTLGDAANVAARLEALNKQFDSEAVISGDVWRIAGLPPELLPRQTTRLRGRSEPLLVHPIQKLEALSTLISSPEKAVG